jgi:basic amino acid/polyamine antiporter, APA family
MDKSDSRGLKPALGLIDATAISVGAIIGASIYVVIGIVAGVAGPALFISMILAATVALFTALSFAELSAWLPREGSVYEFSYRLISPFVGFLAGWMYMLGNAFAVAAVSLGFAFYFAELFPFANPKIVALLLCLAFTVINFFGIRQSAKLNDILVGAKLLILSFFVILGLGYFHFENFQPFAPLKNGNYIRCLL